jgi:hypothetical protein
VSHFLARTSMQEISTSGILRSFYTVKFSGSFPSLTPLYNWKSSSNDESPFIVLYNVVIEQFLARVTG